MKKIYLLFCFSLLFFSSILKSQESLKPLARDVQKLKSSKLKGNIKNIELFKENVRSGRMSLYADAVKDAKVLQLNKNALGEVLEESPMGITMSLPYEDSVLTLELVKVDIYSSDFNVTTDKGEFKEYKKGQFYRGIVNGDINSVVSLSLLESEVSGLIATKELGSITLGKVTDSDNYLVFQDNKLDFKPGTFCSSSDVVSQNANLLVYNPSMRMQATPTTTKYVKQSYEIDNYTYKDHGSNLQRIVDWMGAIHHNVMTLYYNDGINIFFHSLYVWEGSDPYTALIGDSTTTSMTFLDKFRNSGAIHSGDLAHLITTTSQNLGGRAQLSALCSGHKRNAFSNVYKDYKSVPTYSWTVYVVAHEIGHNLGSQHTQACVWNGNSTAIDGCVDSEGSCSNGPIPPKNGGTIMSYCHTNNLVGVSFANGFGEQPSAVMRNYIERNTCVRSGPIIKYVIPNGTGDGSSWANAGELSAILLAAHNNRDEGYFSDTVPLQIWASKGYYTPTNTYGGGADRDRTFLMVKNVQIYGGFNGDETRLDQRYGLGYNESVLDGNGSVSHVVMSIGDVGVALLDGFVIYRGNATHDSEYNLNGEGVNNQYGGGMYIDNSSPLIRNTIIKNNKARQRGAGVYLENHSKPVFHNVVVMDNITDHQNGDGGGFYVNDDNTKLTLINCTVVRNEARHGGAIRFDDDAFFVAYNSIFYDNYVAENQGNLNEEFGFNTSKTSYNAFVERNRNTIVTNVFRYFNQGTDDTRADPNIPQYGYTFNLPSAAYHRGNTDLYSNNVNSNTDIVGGKRIVGGRIDVGAWEYQCSSSLPVSNGATVSLCKNAFKVSDLIAKINAPTISVYATSTSYDPLTSTTVLSPNLTYYIQRTDGNGCKSNRISIKVAEENLPIESTFGSILCEGTSKLSDINFSGTGITGFKWYATQTGGTALSTTTLLRKDVLYYISTISSSGCESSTRTQYTPQFSTKATKPTGQSTQIFGLGKKVSDIVVSESERVFWAASLTDIANGKYLNFSDDLETKDYYAVNFNGNCHSEPFKVSVVVDKTLSVSNVDKNDFTVFPIPFKDILNVENKEMISEIVVYNVSGQLVYSSSNVNSKKITLKTSNWNEGVYVIQLKSNGAILTKKIKK